MKGQIFIVKLEVQPRFNCSFPRVEAKQMACLIRNGVLANSRSRAGLVQFKVIVKRGRDVASAGGEIGWRESEQFSGSPDELAAEPASRY